MSAFPDFDTLDEWIAWLEQAHPIHQIELGLNRIQEVAQRAELTHLGAPVITVAGTNGKGTVVAALESLSEHHQLSVASYTSPHLLTFNERIKLDGQPVSDEELIAGFRYVASHQQDTPLTYFEFTTLVAFRLFQQRANDLIVLEVGLGGRLDAVNIIDPTISIITSIGLDHVAWLGDTLEKVAHEKAGIMRPNTPVIIADPNTSALLLPEADSRQALSVMALEDYSYQEQGAQWSFETSIDSRTYHFNDLQTNDLLVTNLAAALQAFLLLFYQSSNSQRVQKSFENLSFMGRFQYLSKQPLVVVDVAHNPDSAKVLNTKIEQLKIDKGLRVSAICGMLKDKDMASCLAKCTAIDQWMCIDLPGPRGAAAEELIDKLPEVCRNNAKSYHLLVDAFEEYWQHRQDNEALIVFGSFITVGMMLEWWNEFENNTQ